MKTKRPRSVHSGALALTAIISMLLAACGGGDNGGTEPAPGPNGEDPPAATETDAEPPEFGDPLRLSLGHRVFFDVIAWDSVARDQGFYEAAGVRVSDERIFPEGSADAIQGLISGSIDIAVGVGLFALMSALEQGADIKVAAAQYQGYGDIVYYVSAESDITSIDDLSGRSIAISRPGATTDMIALEIAATVEREGGVRPELITVGGPPATFTAVTTGQVDVGWTVPPFFFAEMEDGTLRRLFDADEVVSRYAGTTARVTLVRAELLEERLADVQAFFGVYQQSVEWMFANLDVATEAWARDAGLDQPLDELVRAVSMAYAPEALVMTDLNGLDEIEAAAIELGFLDGPLPPGAMDEADAISRVLQN